MNLSSPSVAVGVLCALLVGCATPKPAPAPQVYDARRVTVYAVVSAQPLNGLALTKGTQEFVLWSSDRATPLRPSTEIYRLDDVRWIEPENQPVAMVQTPAPPPVAAQPVQPNPRAAPETMVAVLHVPFATNSATLSDSASRLLALAMKGSVLRILRIEGHADATGNAAKNDALAAARANAVATSIHQLAPALALPTVVSNGARSPRASNATAEGRTLNRRVDLSLTTEARTSTSVETFNTDPKKSSGEMNEAN